MSKRQKSSSEELGLAIGLILKKHLLKTVDLHYGYWTDDLALDISNLPRAQEKHSNFIISHLPEGAKTVLDVGCGADLLARLLLDNGHQVDCISPSAVLTEEATKLLGDKARIYQCNFEKLDAEKKYDVLLFSDSFQYVRLIERFNSR